MELGTQTQAWLAGGSHLAIEGKQIFAYERGRRGKPVVLLIHGFPTSGHDWRRVAAELGDDFHCIAFDLPGFGLSDKPIAYSYSLFQQADVVEGLLEALDIDAAHVVSHDMGTSIHTELLARKGRAGLSFAILSSTFLNGSILKGMAQLSEFQKMLETPSRLKEAAARSAAMVPSYVDSLKRIMGHPDAVTGDDAIVMTELLAHNDGHLRLPHVYAYVRERYLMQEAWLDAIVTERDPVQFVWGTDDPIAVIEIGRELAARAPAARLTELPGVGHFVPIEAAGDVADAIRWIATSADGAQAIERAAAPA